MPAATVTTGRPPWHPPGERPPEWEPFPREAVESSIGARLRAVAAAHPERIALRGPTRTSTYAELDAFVVSRALGLRARLGGAAAQAAVAVLADHDVALVEALLAVVAAGHPVLVLDPTAPAGLNRALLEDAEVPLVLTDRSQSALAAELAGHRDVTGIEELEPGEGRLPPVDAGAPAMLAYTSGTSGDPKAAVVPNRQLLHLVRGASEALAIRPDDRLPMLFPLSLAVAAYPALLPLLCGASLATFDVRGRGFADLPGWLAAEAVTVAYLAPTVVRFLEGSIGAARFPALRLVVLGGERVDQGAVDLTRRLFGEHVEVAVGYGTTETGVISFWFTGGGTEGDSVPVGFPIAGMDLRIVGDDGRPLPPGQTGELTVRSPYLFAGYRGRPDLDQQVLTEDPATGVPVYRTGDLARLRDDGALELAGRADTQVKVRGRRVVLAEVEEALLALAQVRDAVVVAGRDGAGHTVVAAHVVGADGAEVTVDGLRAELAGSMPDHMVPATVVIHEHLPQLPNGKLDRQALADDGRDRPRLSTELVEAGSGLEQDLVALWERLLGVAPIGIDDDFFDLGGNSLLAARMLVELERDLGRRVPMAALLDGATVRALAAAVEASDAGARPASGLVTIQEGEASRPALYVAHDLHGSAFRFRHLAAALGPDQPVKGFESPALTGERFPFTRIETLALRYATEVQRDQPHGPYLLCGYSFGGILAFEMARHLRKVGEEVALLAVVDIGPGYQGVYHDRRRPPPPPWLELPAPPEPGSSRWERARHSARVLLTSRPGTSATYLAFNSRFRRRLYPVGWWWQLRRHGTIPPEHRLWYAYQTHWDLVAPTWEGAPYDGDIVLFWSEETGSTDATMGWGRLGATVEIHRLAVEHERVMDEDRVGELARPLREAIDRATARS